jgi:hypothetical protein
MERRVMQALKRRRGEPKIAVQQTGATARLPSFLMKRKPPRHDTWMRDIVPLHRLHMSAEEASAYSHVMPLF